MSQDISILEILIRLTLAIMIGGLVGFEREFKNRPAGTKTHILVAVGACVIGLIQKQIGIDALQVAISNPTLTGVIRSDEARLIAQVVSGIGFLGAGTIIVTKRSVVGLTTAASIWAVAGLGIASGMGYYQIAISGVISILLALTLVNGLIQKVAMSKKIEIKYTHKKETQEFIHGYFKEHHIKMVDIDFTVDILEDEKIYTSVYTVDLPRNTHYPQVVEDIAKIAHIRKIRTIRI